MKRDLVLGIGAPLMDFLVEVGDDFLATVPGAAGDTTMVAAAAVEDVLARAGGAVTRAPGGSEANTICALANLGVPAAFFGKAGRDALADEYRAALVAQGAQVLLAASAQPTGRVASLIDRRGGRTMLTALGAAGTLTAADLAAAPFDRARIVHVSGYLLFHEAVARAVIERAAGAALCFDLAAFGVVAATRPLMTEVVARHARYVLANEDEARALLGYDDPPRAARELARHAEIAAVKVGAAGAYLARGAELVHAPGLPARAVDSTGAGDAWAAGFLSGVRAGAPLAECGRRGNVIGARVVAVRGAHLDAAAWAEVRATLGGTPPPARD